MDTLALQLAHFIRQAWCTTEEQETAQRFLHFLATNNNAFSRENRGHVTSSIWIVNAEKTAALLTHHKKFNLWIQLGGHNDGNIDCKQVAAQEALEESGIEGLTFLSEQIFDIDIHPIPNACTYHYDVRYLMQAPAKSSYSVSAESYDLAWVSFDALPTFSEHTSVLRMNEKFKRYFL